MVKLGLSFVYVYIYIFLMNWDVNMIIVPQNKRDSYGLGKCRALRNSLRVTQSKMV